MIVSKFEDVKWIYSEAMGLHIGVEAGLPSNEFADIVYAKMAGGATLPIHFHNRPDPNGYEAFFFHQGADITVQLDDGKEEKFNRSSPFHLTFGHKELHGLVNNSQEDLVFEVLCAPMHQEDEETIV